MELLVLALRLLLIGVLYGFIALVVREIRRDLRRSPVSPIVARLTVAQTRARAVAIGHAIELGQSTLIGRHPECALRLEDEHASSRHAEVQRKGAGWVIRDLGSTNGTRVNGRTVAGETSLSHGDLIEIGTVTLRFEAGPAE